MSTPGDLPGDPVALSTPGDLPGDPVALSTPGDLPGDPVALSTPGDFPGDPVALLPHRPPFRFVDAVDELVAGERCMARYRVTGDERFLAGHFPGNPVFPGVLQLEALAQTGAVALLSHERYAGTLPLFGGVEEARFRRQVVPGDELVLAVTMEKLSSRAGWGRAEATVAGKRACTARLLFVLAPAP